ncbi:hypothetical protein BDV95DRAFT_666250 [Massariosphaeria phaeospora]|uniref:F-box domain-containing protein n=1 Tax=Massariosphaeria phaeospora TaxID=100035 RepID=A0A7C8ME24_9PLEO|nr:hypothetical protein BDV95DRAFT_666250 [Massariosphaeria phaeospora]
MLSSSATPIATATALTRTLSIPELHEAILLHTDQKTLLISCLPVSRTWHHLITTSPALQRHLFFLSPTPARQPRTQAPPNDDEQNNYTLNPLIDINFPHWFTHTGIDDEEWDTLYAHVEPLAPISNENSMGTKKFLSLAWNQRPAVWRRRDASWRRMQIADPPIRNVLVKWDSEGEGGVSEQRGSTTLPADQSGLTMGQLYGYMENMLVRQEWFCDSELCYFTLCISRGHDEQRACTLDIYFNEWQTCSIVEAEDWPGIARFWSEEGCGKGLEVELSEGEEIPEGQSSRTAILFQ